MSAAIPRAALLRVFFRSFFLQAGWNPEGMQNLGFCYAITPALTALYPDETERRRALERHLDFFNCHPYLAAAILGATIFQEERVARGELAPDAPAQLKRALGPPLAALGDGFFWLGLRPACALLAALSVPALGMWSLLVFLGLYNSVHLAARAALFFGGVRRGPGVVEWIKQLRIASATSALKITASLAAGAIAGTAVLAAFGPRHPLRALLAAASIGAATLLSPRLRPLLLLYLALLSGFVFSLLRALAASGGVSWWVDLTQRLV